jgi:inositol phosphorylceramide mannosyltransferase catalytic subunit
MKIISFCICLMLPFCAQLSAAPAKTNGNFFAPWPADYTNAVPNGHWSKEIEMSKKLYEVWRGQPLRLEKWCIPPIIHFIWLGRPLPPSCQQIVESWKKHHPLWLFKVWTDEEAKVFPFRNRAAFDAAKNYGEKADIFRLEILFRYGGLYADTDVECLKPFDVLCQTCDLFAGLCENNNLGNAVMGACPKHPIIQQLLKNIKPGSGDNDRLRITSSTGPIAFTKCFFLMAKQFEGKVVVFPPSYFYPFTLTDHFKFPNATIEEIRTYIQPETMAIHYWNASWIVKNITP